MIVLTSGLLLIKLLTFWGAELSIKPRKIALVPSTVRVKDCSVDEVSKTPLQDVSTSATVTIFAPKEAACSGTEKVATLEKTAVGPDAV